MSTQDTEFNKRIELTEQMIKTADRLIALKMIYARAFPEKSFTEINEEIEKELKRKQSFVEKVAT